VGSTNGSLGLVDGLPLIRRLPLLFSNRARMDGTLRCSTQQRWDVRPLSRTLSRRTAGAPVHAGRGPGAGTHPQAGKSIRVLMLDEAQARGVGARKQATVLERCPLPCSPSNPGDSLSNSPCVSSSTVVRRRLLQPVLRPLPLQRLQLLLYRLHVTAPCTPHETPNTRFASPFATCTLPQRKARDSGSHS